MKIEYTNTRPETKIKSLEGGEVFIYENELYLMTDNVDMNDDSHSAVDIETGMLESFSPEVVVSVVEARLLVSGVGA